VTSEPRIRWAPRLRTDRVVTLYESNASGVLDPDLVDEVGWRLWERLGDVIRVTNGKVRCPVCQAEFQVRVPGEVPDTVKTCPTCGWRVTARTWHKSWEHQGLNGNCEEFDHFVRSYPAATTASQRMILIDAAVHALHVSVRDDLPGNFAARNFLEGSRPKIVALLEELANGPGSAIAEGARQRWEAARKQHRPRRTGGGSSP
jgi:hypothetical protein